MVALLLLALLSAAAAADTRPNILLLFPDQWRFDWDGFHASLDIPLTLPHIHKLATGGTRFTHAYVPAPVCAPSRSCLAAQREYDHAGVPNNFNNDYNISIPTFYGQLRDAGYHTMTCGKDDLDKATQLGTRDGLGGNWTGTYHQAELGFVDGLRCEGKGDVVDEPQPHERYGHWLSQQTVTLANGSTMTGWEAHYECMKGAARAGGRKGKHCTSDMFPDRLYEDNWVTTTALTLLRRKPKGKPWFLQVNFPGPPVKILCRNTFSDRTRAALHSYIRLGSSFLRSVLCKCMTGTRRSW